LLDEKELKELVEKDEFIRDVEEERLMFSESEKEEILKISIDMAERDQLSILSTAKRKAEEEGRKKGMKKGMEEGIEKGIEKGIKKGIERGKEEAMFDFAKKT